jgi:hypothetical protein
VRVVSSHGESVRRRRNNTIVGALVAAMLSGLLIDVAGGALLYDVAATVDYFMLSGPGIPVAVVYIFLGAIPVTLVHELGHAFAARRLLDTSVDIGIGSFGEFARVQLGEISMRVNALASPLRAAGSAEFDASDAYARDVLLIALAGPAASAIGTVVAIAALAVAPADGVIHDFVWATVLGSVFGVLNLIPFKYQDRANGPVHQSDGWLALHAARTMHALR